MTHTIEGTWDEIQAYAAGLAGHRLRVIVDPEDEDHGAPEHLIVRDAAQLHQLLKEGLASPKSPMVDSDWDDIRQEVRRRAAARRTANG
jgi:hypothetical protein